MNDEVVYSEEELKQIEYFLETNQSTTYNQKIKYIFCLIKLSKNEFNEGSNEKSYKYLCDARQVLSNLRANNNSEKLKELDVIIDDQVVLLSGENFKNSKILESIEYIAMVSEKSIGVEDISVCNKYLDSLNSLLKLITFKEYRDKAIVIVRKIEDLIKIKYNLGDKILIDIQNEKLDLNDQKTLDEQKKRLIEEIDRLEKENETNREHIRKVYDNCCYDDFDFTGFRVLGRIFASLINTIPYLVICGVLATLSITPSFISLLLIFGGTSLVSQGLATIYFKKHRNHKNELAAVIAKILGDLNIEEDYDIYDKNKNNIKELEMQLEELRRTNKPLIIDHKVSDINNVNSVNDRTSHEINKKIDEIYFKIISDKREYKKKFKILNLIKKYKKATSKKLFSYNTKYVFLINMLVFFVLGASASIVGVPTTSMAIFGGAYTLIIGIVEMLINKKEKNMHKEAITRCAIAEDINLDDYDIESLQDELNKLLSNINQNEKELLKEKMELSYACRKEKEFREELRQKEKMIANQKNTEITQGTDPSLSLRI